MKTSSFIVRLINIIAIFGVLIAYNQILSGRERDDHIAQLTAQVQTMELMSARAQEAAANEGGEEEDAGLYVNGTYTGEAQGYGGPIQVEVLVENGYMSGISITSAEAEDGAYLTMAEDVIPAILEEQNTEVDTITGATFSSTGIKDAVALALEEAQK